MEPKFKIGDKVRIITKYNMLNNYVSEVADIIPVYDGSLAYILKGIIQPAFKDDTLELVKEETRKIIGYKVPFDMFNGDWKKDDVVIGIGDLFYHISGIVFHTIPKEIAETWEPVYEEVKVETPKTIFERVNSFEDACREIGFLSYCSESLSPKIKLEIVCKALNEGWIADWKPSDEKKWYVFYDGITLNYNVTTQYTIMPRSLYVKSGELARHLRKIAEKELLEYFEVLDC